MPDPYVHVYTARGQLEAEMIRLFLESKAVQSVAYGESVGTIYGLTVAPVGGVKIYVSEDQAQDAQQLLADMDAGKYDLPQIQGPGDEDTNLPEEPGD